jgi:hypothetical protein
LVTTGLSYVDLLKDPLKALLIGSGFKDFKWETVRDAKGRFAAMKLIDFCIKHASPGDLRIDVLTWDIEDTRHKIKGRDDIENLKRMYYHLLKNVLTKRWPDDCAWVLNPDENTAMDWGTLSDCLENRSRSIRDIDPLFIANGSDILFKRNYNIIDINPRKSHEEPFIQMADFFVGMGVYSRKKYNLYERWRINRTGQDMLFDKFNAAAHRLSKGDEVRCDVVSLLSERLKKARMGVKLGCNGLITYNPKNPINFWPYKPQRERERAPVKRR